MKKRIAFLLILCLIMGTPLTALAARPNTPGPPARVVTPLYLNLGDSIAYGLSADPGKSYFDRYARTLQPGLAVNLGWAGLTSRDLQTGLGSSDVKMAVAGADVITISIGGNNLLSLVIAAAFGAYGLDYEDFGDDSEAALTALYTAIYQAEMIQPGTWQANVNLILTSSELSGLLMAGANSFVVDWSLMIDSIRSLNENAVIKVLNLYNPVNQEDNPVLYDVFERLLAPMNGILNQLQGPYDYQVIDVYTAFMKDDKAVAFSLELASLNLDPHPTTKGHQIIFRELMKSGNPRSVSLAMPLPITTLGNETAISESVDMTGLPAAHGATGAEFGELVAQTAQEDPAFLADHASSQTVGLPAAHEDAEGNPLSGFGFGQAVSGLVREDPGALVDHIR